MAHLSALFTICVWGITFIATKLLLASFSAQEILFIRFFLGWLTLWLLCPRVLPLQRMGVELTFCLAGFCGVTLYFLLENVALNYTTASNVGVIVTTAPFFTGLAEWLLFRGSKPGRWFLPGFGLAMAGIALVSWPDSALAISPRGDFLALMAAIAWAFYSCLTGRIASLRLGPLLATRRTFFWGLVLMAPVFAITGWQADRAALFNIDNILNLVFLGVGASAICFASWTFALARMGAARVSVYIYMVPVITVICAHLMLHEDITLMMVVGMILVIGGVVISSRGEGPDRPGSLRRGQGNPERPIPERENAPKTIP